MKDYFDSNAYHEKHIKDIFNKHGWRYEEAANNLYFIHENPDIVVQVEIYEQQQIIRLLDSAMNTKNTFNFYGWYSIYTDQYIYGIINTVEAIESIQEGTR